METEKLLERIQAYLSGGGLFNPEMADHDAVRDLIIDCRDAIQGSSQPPAVTAWAVFGPDGECMPWSIREQKSWCMHEWMDNRPGTTWNDWEAKGYTCERVKITRLGKEGRDEK